MIKTVGTVLFFLRNIFIKNRTVPFIFLIGLFLLTGNIYAQAPEEELFNQGREYYEKQMYDEAIVKFNVAIQINLRYAEAYFYRGMTYAKKGDIESAISDYDKALQINPANAQAYYKRGIAYANKDNLNQAISDYNRAIEMKPDYVYTYIGRAIAYFSEREYNKSWEDVRKVESLGEKVDPDFLKELKKASGREN